MRRPRSTPSPIPTPNSSVVRAYFTEDEKEAMLERNLPLVRRVVDRMRIFLPSALDVNDLYSVGFHGLINAVQKYDPSQGTPFAGFATIHIRGAVRDELRRMDWTPRSIRDKARKVREALERVEQRLGRPGTEGEVAAELEIAIDDYWALLDEIRPVSFVPLDDDSSGEGGGEGLFHEKIPDESQTGARELLERNELHRLIVDQINKMPELPRKVLAMYYFEELRLSEIAAVFGLTEGRISQIHTQSVLSLRIFLKRLNNSLLCS